MRKLEKAHEITDARIQFVSLVDKAANKRSFLITKQAGGEATFTTYGRIIKTDADQHYVTGIVYEPLVEDSQGDYMTASEIEKACHWFAKNGNQIDLQHSFEPLKDAVVVESWVAKADFDVDGESIKKGTWLMTVEVADNDVWEAIQKGDITGFSMGGKGTFNEEDTDLSTFEKDHAAHEKKGLFKQMANLFGFDVVEKGQVADRFEARDKYEEFWSAFDALRNTLSRWDGMTEKTVYETDEDNIKEALSEFGEIITSILLEKEPVAKSLYLARPVEKAGKKMSGKNKEALQGIYDNLGTFLASFDEPEETGESDGESGEVNKNEVKKEEIDMTKQELESIVQDAVKKAVSAINPDENLLEKSEDTPEGGEITRESIQKMVDAAVQKAMQPKEETVTADKVAEMVEKAVQKAMEPVLKARGVSSNLNDEGGQEVEKNDEQHYLHGIL